MRREVSVNIRRIEGQGGPAADALAGLHLEAFPGFFLTSLGRRFLRLLYAGFMSAPEAICLVAEDNGDTLGFAAGTVNPAGFFRRLLRQRALAFALAAFPGLVRNPLFAARKCLGALFYRGETPAGLPEAALLSSLAVSPAAQGRGVGQALVAAFVEDIRRRGGKTVYLTTDENENERTNRFYARCGFVLLDTFNRPGRRTMNRWVLKIT